MTSERRLCWSTSWSSWRPSKESSDIHRTAFRGRWVRGCGTMIGFHKLRHRRLFLFVFFFYHYAFIQLTFFQKYDNQLQPNLMRSLSEVISHQIKTNCLIGIFFFVGKQWWGVGQKRSDVAWEPHPRQADADQVRWHFQPLQATGALHRVGWTHLRGVFCTGTVRTPCCYVNAPWCSSGWCCVFCVLFLLLLVTFFSSISGADGRGEETRSPGGYACVWQEHL